MGKKQRLKPRRVREEDTESILVRDTLAAKFPTVETYRDDYESIRVRIIDPRFSGKNRVKRERMVLPLIHSLPDDIQNQIVILLLFAPGEENESFLNLEFENPDRKPR